MNQNKNKLNPNVVDPDGLLEYSVVYTDRSLNHMSRKFQGVMKYLSEQLSEVYHADATIVIPGGGTYAMEAVVRQFVQNQKCIIIRNGWFSFRWTQIIDACGLTKHATVLQGCFDRATDKPKLSPPPLEEVVRKIHEEKPNLVFVPHVETSAGLMLSDTYLRKIGEASGSVGALMVLDCIASGTIWVDMQECLVDVLISAPQKGWSSTPCAGLVMMNDRALDRLNETHSDSFSMDLKKWHGIMQTYLNGRHAYHATMPTDGLNQFADTVKEMEKIGFEELKKRQKELGQRIDGLLREKGFSRLASKGNEAFGVVVSYTDDAEISNGKKFVEVGVQIAAGVPLRCDEKENFQTFRIGLFGLDKLLDIDRTYQYLADALKKLT